VVISNHNSFRVLFDKIASVYFVYSVYFMRKIYPYFSIGNGRPREPALCQLYRHTFVPHRPQLGRAYMARGDSSRYRAAPDGHAIARLTSQLPAQSTALFHFHQAVQACCVVRLIISRDGELRTGCKQGDPHDFG